MSEQTTKLYYKDAYISETPASILRSQKIQNEQWYAFDKTIFYPGGGGQKADSGWINDLDLCQIKEKEGTIWHQINEELSGDVYLKLDWTLRFQRMQQHAGQHLVSAVFYREFGISTVSVHLGQVDTLIEFNTPDFDEGLLYQAEEKANHLIRQAIPIKALWVSREQLANYDLRREVKLHADRVRLVQIGEYDITGCGGIHVDNTSQIGLIKIIGTEKIRQRQRIQFRIGQAAYELFDMCFNALHHISNELSCKHTEVGKRVTKLFSDQTDLRQRINDYRSKWLKLKASDLSPQANYGFYFLGEFSKNDLIDLSALWLEEHAKPCFFIGQDGDKTIFVSRSIAENPSALVFIKSHSSALHLRGGGSDEFVQGSIMCESMDSNYLDQLQEIFRKTFEGNN